jgi:hypothetical protein
MKKTIKEIAVNYKSNLEHIEFLENKVKDLEKNLIDGYQYINGLTHITDVDDIREYTNIMIKKLKDKKINY